MLLFKIAGVSEIRELLPLRLWKCHVLLQRHFSGQHTDSLEVTKQKAFSLLFFLQLALIHYCIQIPTIKTKGKEGGRRVSLVSLWPLVVFASCKVSIPALMLPSLWVQSPHNSHRHIPVIYQSIVGLVLIQLPGHSHTWTSNAIWGP